jgi:hypothetical protein
MVTLCSASRRPAGVSRMRRPAGSISAVPVSRASAAICWDTVEVVSSISSATARIEPSRASSSSIRRRRVSTAPLFRNDEHSVHNSRVDVGSAGGVYWSA